MSDARAEPPLRNLTALDLTDGRLYQHGFPHAVFTRLRREAPVWRQAAPQAFRGEEQGRPCTEEWNVIVRSWTAERTTAVIIERAALLRLRMAPIGNGEPLPRHAQLVARRVFVASANGRFLQPRRPYRIDDAEPPAPRPAPRLGEHTDAAGFAPARPVHVTGSNDALPLTGLPEAAPHFLHANREAI